MILFFTVNVVMIQLFVASFFLDIKMFKDFKIKMFNFSYLKYHLKLSIFKFYEIYECIYIYIYKIEMYMR